MKSASEGRDPSKDGYGKAEELAGKVAGCEGMEKEGAASAKKEWEYQIYVSGPTGRRNSAIRSRRFLINRQQDQHYTAFTPDQRN